VIERLPLSFPGHELSCVGLCFGTPEAPSLTTVPIKAATFSVTSICKDLAEEEANDVRLPACDAYFLMLYLEDAGHADIRADGTCTPVRHYEQGSICLVDLDEGAAIRLHSRLNSLTFVLPKTLFEEAASLSPNTEMRRLACRRGKPDDVLANLGTALLALLTGGRTASPPALLRHMAVAICAHLLHQYGETPESDPAGDRPSSGSTAAQQVAGSDASPLYPIATGAGLAEEKFLADFKRATGLAPIQWLMRIRVERAKELMEEHTLSIEDIARQCGFSDLEQFNQVFAGETGMTPAAWSRKRVN
jgi:AraC family transcriptional regulator